MKTLKALALGVLCLAMLGCGAMREAGIWASEEEFRNYDAGKEAAETFLLSWPFQSGLIRCGLGSNVDKLPADVLSAMAELDAWAELPSAQMTDQMWGCVLVYQARVKSQVARYVFQQYAPGLFQAISLLH